MTNGPVAKGWCPGALRPMASGDGLIVRLRITGGIVRLALARQIARWSRQWGNGEIDLSNRANLQLRGLAPQHLPALHAALVEASLLDSSEAAEAVRNVIASPLAGLDPDAVLDIRPTVRQLEQRLVGTPALHALPGKFGFAIDDGGARALGDLPVDVTFAARRSADGPVFDVHLAGAEEHAQPAAILPSGLARSVAVTVTEAHRPICRPDTLPAVSEALATVFLRLRNGQESRIRRMRDVVAVYGAEAILRAAGLFGPPPTMPAARSAPILGVNPIGDVAFLGVGLPFGRITAENFAELASVASENGARDLRLTPWRAILIPVETLSAARAIAARLPRDSVILDPTDPRRRIAACPGAPACPRAITDLRAEASALVATMARTDAPPGITLHITGCEKGCAHPQPAPITLVARDGSYDLIRNATASATPAQRDLTLDKIRSILAGAA